MKVALVTGSSSGIGRGLVLALAGLGCAVTVNYARSEDKARETADELSELGGEFLLCQADVSRPADCRKLVGHTLEKWGRLDYLVNNAGVTKRASADQLSEEDWDTIFGVNVKGAFFLAQEAREVLKESSGSIVNVSSTAGLDGFGSSVAYSASKAALNNLTMSLAREFAPEIRVNGVAPGFVETPWIDRHFPERPGAIRKLAQSRTCTGKLNEVEDVVEVVLALLTGMNQVTGQTVVVDGGYRR